MSTLSRPYYLIFAALFQILHFFTNAAGQEIVARIEVEPGPNALVRISGSFASALRPRNLSFLRSVAGLSGLGERISDVRLKSSGRPVTYQAASRSEYLADEPFDEWTYAVDLTPRKEQSAAAHVSWLTDERGLLMLGDLLPTASENENATSAKVKIILPAGWRQLENRLDETLVTENAENEVIAVGKNLRFRTVHVGGTAISICLDGEWLFSSDEITSFVQQIYGRLSETFDTPAAKSVFVNVFRFPQNAPPGQWQAETRGTSVTIISSDMSFKTQSLQRLHEQLRHEMFHLWIPNGVNLSGNYDWFYEGFALYASLKVAVATNQIRFEDLLDTLSRAHAIDSRQTDRLSLVQASADRWNGFETYIYARGMVTAFLCDVLMMSNSKGRRSINDLLREFYFKHKFPNERANGNDAALSLFRSRPELSKVVDKYINGPGKLDWQNELQLAGLEGSNGLKVIAKPSGRQKDLLDALGYNNWRRLSQAN